MLKAYSIVHKITNYYPLLSTNSYYNISPYYNITPLFLPIRNICKSKKNI